MLDFYTGSKAQVIDTGEMVEVVAVLPATNVCVGRGIVVRDAHGERTYTEAWLRAEPEGDTDPFDNVDDSWLEQAFEDSISGGF